eukprot:3259372-Rhodomonas_salina.2
MARTDMFLSAYALAMRCPVLRSHMVLPGLSAVQLDEEHQRVRIFNPLSKFEMRTQNFEKTMKSDPITLKSQRRFLDVDTICDLR